MPSDDARRLGHAALIGVFAASALLAVQPIAAATAISFTFGIAADGKAIPLVTLRNGNGMLVSFTARGGAVTEILAPDRTGKLANVVLGRPDFAAWERGGSFNSVVGRFANRIGGGGFSLDGQFYKLPSNPTTHVAIHGGPNGFSSKVWQPELFQRADAAGAVMTYVSADGENGFPGELTVRMTYTLTEENVFRIDYEAVTTKPTVINLTNHSYFNLGGADSGPVNEQVMQVFASRYTPTDERQVPTGELASVENTPFDFRKPARLGDRLHSTHPQMMQAKGLDHNFVLDRPGGVAATLYDPRSGRRMEVRTSEPGVQIYSGNNFNGSQLGAGGRTLRQSDGIAFETQHFPDSPNKPNFPSTILRPGETFRSWTEYAFSTDAKRRR